MSKRWMVAIAAVAALFLAGCSDSEPTITKTTSSVAATSASAAETATATAEDAALEPLGTGPCVEVTQANLDLAVATSKEDARKAADTLKKYDLPGSVDEAVEHFVETGGAQYDDPDFTKYNGELEKWVKGVCP